MTAVGRVKTAAAVVDVAPRGADNSPLPLDGAADWPAQGWVDDVRPALERARQAGRTCALVTLRGAESPSPRPVGAQMLVGDEVVGHLSSGCIEADVAIHAHACMTDGEPRRLVYGRGSPWRDISLACGGRLDLLVERVPPRDAAVGQLLRRTRARLPAALVSDGRVRRVVTTDPAPDPPDSGYVRSYAPATRLVVVGRDPTALAICVLGLQIGFEVVLVTPHGPAEPPPMEGLRYLRSSPAAAFEATGLDHWTAVVVATHDEAWDRRALAAALPSQAAYVGALGARARLADQRTRLQMEGVAHASLARLHAPIGQPCYGKDAWTIAVTTISEILQVMSDPRSPVDRGS